MRFDGSFQAWFALGWSVIVLSLGAITLLMLLIRLGDVGRVSGLIFLVPGVSALMAYGLFGETLSLVQIIGHGGLRRGRADRHAETRSPALRRASVSRARWRWASVTWVRTTLKAASRTARSSVKPRPSTMSGTRSIGRTK